MTYIDADRLTELLERVKRCGEILDPSCIEEAPVVIGMMAYCAVNGDCAMYKKILKEAIKIRPQLDNILEVEE